MKKLFNPFLSVLIIAAAIGLTVVACTEETPKEETYFLDVADVGDGIWDTGNEYEEVYIVTFDGAAPEGEVIAETTVEGLPGGIIATIVYYGIGDPTDGSVAPLSTPIVPYQAAVNYNVQSTVSPGTASVTITVSSGEDGVEPVSETFMLTVNDPNTGSTDCNTDLAGDYAGPGTCAPQGWGDTHVDFAVTTDPNTLDVYIEFFDQGSTVTATLDCNNNSFTIPQQVCTVGNGAQQVNVDGGGTWVIGQSSTTINLMYNTQVVGSTDPPAACQVDLTKQ